MSYFIQALPNAGRFKVLKADEEAPELSWLPPPLGHPIFLFMLNPSRASIDYFIHCLSS